MPTGVLIFCAVVVVVVGGTFTVALWLTKPKPSGSTLVLLGAAAGRPEAQLWAQRLRKAGIRVHIRNVGDSAWLAGPYVYEVWVRPKDEKRAHQVLGLR